MNLRNIFCKNFLLSLVLLLATQRLSAVSYYVAPTATGNGSGSDASNKSATLQKVINDFDLNSGDIIYLDAGTYTEKGITLESDDEGFTIQGAALDASGIPTTIFDSNQTDSWLKISRGENDDIKISKIKAIDYKATGSTTGGGFLKVITANASGGDFGNTGIIIEYCLIDNCDGPTSGTTGGGALFISSYGPAGIKVTDTKIQNCNIGGAGTDGAGLYVASAYTSIITVEVEKTIFYNNTCVDAGSAIYLDGVNTLGSSTALIRNCLIYSCQSTTYGGNIWLTGNIDVNIYNCTIMDNTDAGTSYGAIHSNVTTGKTTSIYNCISYNNNGYDFMRAAGTMNVNNSVYGDKFGTITFSNSQVSTNPNVIGGGNYRLSLTSPCINSGIGTPGNGNYPSVDLDGNTRTGPIDIGCYEYVCSESYSDAINGGPYKVGPTNAKWTSLTNAILSLKACMVGSTTLELTSDYNSNVENFPINFNGLPTSFSITLTVRPEANANNLSITNSAGTGTVQLNGADYIFFDGRPGGSTAANYSSTFLTISQTHASTGYAVRLNSDATNNKIEYCNIRSNNNSASSGVITFDTPTSSTGNSNNQINYCDITGTTTPTNAFFSAGSAAGFNSSNTINQCYIHDYFSASSASNGILLSDYNTSWSITNNRFYQTANRTQTTPTQHSAINITGSVGNLGNNFIITGNTIGYSTSSATGAYTIIGVSSTNGTKLVPIYLNLGSTTVSTIHSNTIAGINLSNTKNAVNFTSPSAFTGIFLLAGTANIGASGNPNMIGDSTQSGSITYSSAVSGEYYFGIMSLSSNTVNISYNNIVSFSTGTTTATLIYNVWGIYTNGASTTSITYNKIGDWNTSNSFNAGLSGTSTAASTLVAIQDASTSGNKNIEYNKIYNCTVFGTGSSSYLYGIYYSAGTSTTTSISYNTIEGLTNNAGNIICIYDKATTSTHNINNNKIGNNSSNNISVVGGSSAEGIDVELTGTYSINNNTIQNLSVQTSGADVYGISLGSTGTYNLSGNNIYNLKHINSAASGSGSNIAGIYFSAANASSSIQKNRMTGFSNVASASSSIPTIYGIWNASTGTTLLYNNFFSCNNGGNTNNIQIVGVCDGTIATGTNATTTLFYNTIEIGGTVSTGAISTACFAHMGTTSDKILGCKNNIFKNNRTGGTGKHFCYYVYGSGGGTSSAMASGACDYNYYTASDDAAFSMVGGGGAPDYKTSSQFNASSVTSRGYGGLNSKYFSNGAGNNSSVVTINSDGSLSATDLATVGRGVLLASPCDVDINFVVRATSGGLGGFKGCYEGNCLVVSTHPLNSTICPTQTYSPSIVITNSAGSAVDLTFQLQYSTDNASFSNVSNGTPSNATYGNGNGSLTSIAANSSPSFSSTVSGNLAFGSANYYRYSIIASTGCAINTNSAQLTVTVTPQVNSILTNGDFVWAGLSSSWSTTSNWQTYNGTIFSTATVQPSSSDRVIISAPNSCVTAQPILGSDITIGSLIIESGATLDASTDNRAISLSGDWTNSGTFNERSGKVTFNGTASDQTIGGITYTTFSKLAVNKTTSTNDTLRMNISANVKDSLILVDGIIKTSIANNITLLSNAKTGLGNTGSYINGPLFYVLASSNSTTLNFPIGKSNQWRPVILTAKNTTSTSYTYVAELFNASAEALNYTKPITIDRVSSIHYWDINRYATSNLNTEVPSNEVDGNQIISLYYNINDSVSDVTNLTICKNTATSPNSWEDIGGTGASNTSGSVSSTSNPTSFNSFSRFTLGNKSGGNNILPVQLINFKAFCQNQNILLNWSTTSELNNDYFTIEKSNDGVAFTELAKVKGSGTTTVEQHYAFIDELKNESNNYYQLFQTDYNGDKKWVAMEIANCNEMKGLINAFPNPNNGQFVISGIQPDMIISIIDVLGRTIYQVTSNEKNQEIYLQNLPSGFYTLKCENKSQIYSLKIVVE